MSGESVLDLDGVTKVYGEQPPVAALRGVSFSVRRGELAAIVGPSGSGKSTLLHVMGTLERPSSGVVRIGGVDAAGLGDRELSLLRARNAASRRSSRPAMSIPPMRTVPAVGRSSVPMMCRSVVLPDPDGPTIATSSPRRTEKDTPRRASTGGCSP